MDKENSNKSISILKYSAIKDNFEKEDLSVLDVGSGKGYLTFALYDFLKNSLN